jgi:hypothetical protein
MFPMGTASAEFAGNTPLDILFSRDNVHADAKTENVRMLTPAGHVPVS